MRGYYDKDQTDGWHSKHSSCTCVITVIIPINHHPPHHCFRWNKNSHNVSWIDSAVIFEWMKKNRLLHHCFPSSLCSLHFDKSCWMLFLKLTSNHFILSDEEVEVNREKRHTWNSFIIVTDPLLNHHTHACKHQVHLPHLIEYWLWRLLTVSADRDVAGDGRMCSRRSACHSIWWAVVKHSQWPVHRQHRRC